LNIPLFAVGVALRDLSDGADGFFPGVPWDAFTIFDTTQLHFAVNNP